MSAAGFWGDHAVLKEPIPQKPWNDAAALPDDGPQPELDSDDDDVLPLPEYREGYST